MYVPALRDTDLGANVCEHAYCQYMHSQRMWIARHGVLHSHEDAQLSNVRSPEAPEIRELYQQPHLLRAGDRHFCERSLDRLLNGPPSMRRRCLWRVRKYTGKHRRDGGRHFLSQIISQGRILIDLDNRMVIFLPRTNSRGASLRRGGVHILGLTARTR
jgi:hypothetical protein